MKKAFKWSAIIAFALCLVMGAMYASYQMGETNYQRDTSAKKINDVHKIAQILEEYKEQAGHYPFYDPKPAKEGYVKVPVMVIIGMPSAEASLSARPNPFSISVGRYLSKHLILELSKVLKRKVILPVDPQNVPTTSPNAYFVFFMADQDEYVVLCFSYGPVEYSTEVIPHVNVYALSSAPDMGFLGGMNVQPHYIGDFTKTQLSAIRKEGARADKIFKEISTISVGKK